MREVISLLSSPPGSPDHTRSKVDSLSPQVALRTTKSYAVDNLNDDWNLTIERSSKRRRIRFDSDLESNGAGDDLLGTIDSVNDIDDLLDIGYNHRVASKRLQTKHSFARSKSSVFNGATEPIDNIVFTSSAPELSRNAAHRRDEVLELSSDLSDGLPDDIFSAVERHESSHKKPKPSKQNGFSSRTTDILATLEVNTAHIGPRGNVDEHVNAPLDRRKDKAVAGTKFKGRSAEADGFDDIFTSSQILAQPKLVKSKATGSDNVGDRQVSREEAKAAREAEKERKRLDKETKAQEKQKAADLAEVNKSKIHKKNATPEMLIDLSTSLKNTAVGNQTEEYMKQLEVELTYRQMSIKSGDKESDESMPGHIVRWRRKVTATFSETSGEWEPVARARTDTERHVLIYLKALDFATIAAGHRNDGTNIFPSEAVMKMNLDNHVKSTQGQFGDSTPVYLIEGLTSWIKKHDNAKNRAYMAAVRSQLLPSADGTGEEDSTNTTQATSRKRKKPPSSTQDFSYFTHDLAEDLLLHLQLHHHPIMIVHSTSPSNSSFQIQNLTASLSTRPYRLASQNQNLKSASFCMDTGQVRTGDSTQDTYIKMLQEIQRVTPSMAYGIVGEWRSVGELVKGFREKGNLMLQDVKKSTNKDGGWSDRRLGPMVSKRLYKVFMGLDPTTRDGMS